MNSGCFEDILRGTVVEVVTVPFGAKDVERQHGKVCQYLMGCCVLVSSLVATLYSQFKGGEVYVAHGFQ